MTAQEFCYWLQGYFEISGNALHELNSTQVELVKRHLNLVFAHDIDKKYLEPGKLSAIHEGLPYLAKC